MTTEDKPAESRIEIGKLYRFTHGWDAKQPRDIVQITGPLEHSAVPEPGFTCITKDGMEGWCFLRELGEEVTSFDAEEV